MAEVLHGEGHLALTGSVCKKVIDTLTRQTKLIEKAALKKVIKLPQYTHLTTMPGVGEILGLTGKSLVQPQGSKDNLDDRPNRAGT